MKKAILVVLALMFATTGFAQVITKVTPEERVVQQPTVYRKTYSVEVVEDFTIDDIDNQIAYKNQQIQSWNAAITRVQAEIAELEQKKADALLVE